MELNEGNLLYMTNYGLGIYAFILREYFPGEIVLYISGRMCKPARNPFNNGKHTLMINTLERTAKHKDTENAIAPGGALDFAALHYGISGNALLQALNVEMHMGMELKLDKPKYKATPPVFSYFKSPISNIRPLREVTLVDVYYKIKEPHFRQTTSQLRLISDPQTARNYKATHFHYVTFSGIFSTRKKRGYSATFMFTDH